MMTSRTVTTPSIMARRIAPMALTMPIRHAPIARKTLWIWRMYELSSTRPSNNFFFFLLEEDTYTRDNGTHCKNILLVNSA